MAYGYTRETLVIGLLNQQGRVAHNATQEITTPQQAIHKAILLKGLGQRVFIESIGNPAHVSDEDDEWNRFTHDTLAR